MHRFVVDNEHIKGINGCVVYILQARVISERLHLISVYQVHVKLPYLIMSDELEKTQKAPQRNSSIYMYIFTFHNYYL
jgi:hypothetical protein